MKEMIIASSALLLSIGMLSLGGGLQGTLLGVRSTLEGFSPSTTGMIMSGFFLGYLLGAIYVPRFVQRVGHIRVFGALASISSAAILLHPLIIHSAVWTLIRIVSGFCWAGIGVVTESWLNHNAINKTRGKLLSIYMMIQMIANGCGQLFLNTADPRGFPLFILVSVLISLALVPILLTVAPAPHFETPSVLSLKNLYKISPLGITGTFLVGIAHSALLGMGMVYASKAGFSIGQISLFMALIFLGGAAFQWPLGLLSDRYDRRQVITCVAFAASITAFVALILPSYLPMILLPLIFIVAGFSLPLYSLFIAHTNDHLNPDHMVAASSGLTLVLGLGTTIGPVAAGYFMEALGAGGFFTFLIIVHGLIGIFALYRMTRREAIPLEEQKDIVPFPIRSTPVVANLTQEIADTPKQTGVS